MAVIVSSGNINLNQANGFYASYASNPASFANGANSSLGPFGLALTSGQTISLTFSSNHTCTGVVLCIHLGYAAANATSSTYNRDVTVTLQENVATVWTDRVSKTLTAATIFRNQTYLGGYYFTDFDFGAGYSVTTAASTWRLNVTQGAGSGTAYIGISDATNPFYITYSSTTVTANAGKILKNVTWDTAADTVGYTAHGLTDTTPIVFTPVDQGVGTIAGGLTAGTVYYVKNAAANTFQVAATSGGATINLTGSPTTGWMVLAAGDTPWAVKGKITINCDFVTKGQAGTGYTGRICCGGAVSSSSASTDPFDWAMWEWENPASAKYYFVMDGLLCLSAHSGFNIGTSASRIAYANKAVIISMSNQFANGASPYAGISGAQAGIYYGDTGIAIYMYGAIPSREYCTLTANANVGDSSLTVDDATGFGAGDQLQTSKQDTLGAGSTTILVVSSLTGSTQINISPTVPTNKRFSGAKVFRVGNTGTDGYGIEVRSTTTTSTYQVLSSWVAAFKASGVFTYKQQRKAVFSASYPWNNSSGGLSITNCCCNEAGTHNVPGFALGATMQNNIFYLAGSTTGFFNPWIKVSTLSSGSTFKSGKVIFDNNICVSGSMWNTSGLTNGLLTMRVSNNHFSNCLNGLVLAGPNLEHYNNYYYSIYGNTTIAYCTVSAYLIYSIKNWSGNTYDRCVRPLYLQTIIGEMSGDSFGPTVQNTYDITPAEDSYINSAITMPTTPLPLVFENTVKQSCVDGSALAITDETFAGDDTYYTPLYTLKRCGSGFTDTTQLNSSDTMRFEYLSSTTPGEWVQSVPTGDIQNKDMTIICRVKINSATYYAGTYQKPRLTVTYDDGANEVYDEATNSTGEQLLIVTITPTTTTGFILVKLSGMTDATGSNARVYFGDFSILYPAGVTVNLGKLTNWNLGNPVVPTISTGVNANDVWAADPATAGAGTYGDKLKKSLTIGQFMALK